MPRGKKQEKRMRPDRESGDNFSWTSEGRLHGKVAFKQT